jgi:hypothetical protein
MISVVTLISIDAAELVTGHIGGSFVAVAAGDDIDYTSYATISFIALAWRSSYLSLNPMLCSSCITDLIVIDLFIIMPHCQLSVQIKYQKIVNFGSQTTEPLTCFQKLSIQDIYTRYVIEMKEEDEVEVWLIFILARI